jgi:hypothetical protein
MKRILTIAFALTLLASSAFAEDYQWTLSLSNTDPFVNTGAPVAGLVPVYLWLAGNVPGLPDPGCAAAAEFDMDITNWSNFGFSPVAGVLNAGNENALLLAIGGCPQGPFLAGSFNLFDGTGAGGDACLVPSAANGFNVTVDCDPIAPQNHDNAIIGVSTIGDPCEVGQLGEVAVEASTWGALKGLYR